MYNKLSIRLRFQISFLQIGVRMSYNDFEKVGFRDFIDQ